MRNKKTTAETTEQVTNETAKPELTEMMEITFNNFGGFTEKTLKIESISANNGEGKTTLLNGFLWTLTGRTLTGFTPRKVGTPDTETTSVDLQRFAGVRSIRREIDPYRGGSVLYVNDSAVQQSEFAQIMKDKFIDLDFLAACCDTNLLTSDSLTSEDLRKMLLRAGAMDGEESTQLRKEATELRKQKKVAEQYSASLIAVPSRTIDEISKAELKYIEDFGEQQSISIRGVSLACSMCQREYSKETLERRKEEYSKACKYIKENAEEYNRLRAKLQTYNEETQKIDDANRLIRESTKAREDAMRIDKRLEEIALRITQVEAEAVRAKLPDGVEIITEQTASNGKTKSVCTLTYNGIPLKSINRAKRVEICVLILDQARRAKGVRDLIPIWIDNAESVQGITDIPNTIKLTVPAEYTYKNKNQHYERKDSNKVGSR